VVLFDTGMSWFGESQAAIHDFITVPLIFFSYDSS
jgi:hypothetical protein